MKKSTMTAAVMAAMVAAGVATVPVTAHAAEAPATKYTAAQQAAFKAIFNAEDYASMYPDVAAAFGDDADLLFSHFLLFGISEGRAPSASFNVNAYASAYPDLQAAYGDTTENYYLHYITCGAKEGRDITSISTALKKGKTVYTVSSFEDGIQGPVKAKQQIIAAPNVYRAIAQATSSYTAEAKKDEAKKDEVKPEITVSAMEKWIDEFYSWALAGGNGDMPVLDADTLASAGIKTAEETEDVAIDYSIWQTEAMEIIQENGGYVANEAFLKDANTYNKCMTAYVNAISNGKDTNFDTSYTDTHKANKLKVTSVDKKEATYYVDYADENGKHKKDPVEYTKALDAWAQIIYEEHVNAILKNDANDTYYKAYVPVAQDVSEDGIKTWKVASDDTIYYSLTTAQEAAQELALKKITNEEKPADAIKREAEAYIDKDTDSNKVLATKEVEAHYTIAGITAYNTDTGKFTYSDTATADEKLYHFAGNNSQTAANTAANTIQIAQTKDNLDAYATTIFKDGDPSNTTPAEGLTTEDGKYEDKYLSEDAKDALKDFYTDKIDLGDRKGESGNTIKDALNAVDTDKYEIKVDGANYQEDTVITAENISKITITEKETQK